MKKITATFLSLLLCIVFISSSSILVSASTYTLVNDDSQKAMVSFEITNVMEYAKVYGVYNDEAIIKIPISLNVTDNFYTELVVTIENISDIHQNSLELPIKAFATSGKLNFTVVGKMVVGTIEATAYGLNGSFSYTGKDTRITGYDAYHRSLATGYTGTYTTAIDYFPDLNHISRLSGDYTVSDGGTAWIKIAVSENGIYSVGGQYVSSTVT